MDVETQHSRAANTFIRYSPVPLTQQPTTNGAPKGPFEDAQQPEPYIAANPTRPPTYNIFFLFFNMRYCHTVYYTYKQMMK